MRKAQFVARGGMLAAVSLALLYLSAVMPTGQIGVCAIAGILPAMPLSRTRVKLGVAVYLTALLLGWLIVPLKSVMAAYTVIGMYSIFKYAAERPRRRVLEWFCKLVYCNFSIMLALLAVRAGLFPQASFPPIAIMLACWIAVNLIFIAFDIAFSKLIGFLRRIYPA